MDNQMPWNFGTTGGDNEMGQSSKNENSYDFLDSCVTRPNSWLQTSRSTDTVTSELDDFQDVFGSLMDIQPSAASSAQANISIASTLEIHCKPDKGQSTGTVRKPDEMVLRKCQSDATEISEELDRKANNQPKRTRSAEVHNLSERRRRDRINKRLKTLQELVPNCNKSDRASMLDDAINYVKSLRLQVEMMSTGGRAVFQAPFMSPGGIQSTQGARFSPYVPIRPKLGVGIGFGMCCSVGHPMISVPSATLHPSLSAAGIGLSLMSSPRNISLPQMYQMPFIVHSQQLPASVDTSTMLRNFAPRVSQVESGSETMPSTAH